MDSQGKQTQIDVNLIKKVLPICGCPAILRAATKVKSSCAGVVELVDTQDLKSCSRMRVPVRFRPSVPIYEFRFAKTGNLLA